MIDLGLNMFFFEVRSLNTFTFFSFFFVLEDFKSTNINELSDTLDKFGAYDGQTDSSINTKIILGIDNSLEIIKNCTLFAGLPNLEIALTYLTKVTEYKNVQEYFSQNISVERIVYLVDILQKDPVEAIYYKILDLFVNLSYFMPNFANYFHENNGIQLLEGLITPQSIRMKKSQPKQLKTILRLFHNISSYYASSFREEIILVLIDIIRTMDETCKQLTTSAIINFFRGLTFSTQDNKRRFLTTFHRLFDGKNSKVRENLLWCVYYQTQIDEFFIGDLAVSPFINDIIECIGDQDSYSVAYLTFCILSQIVLCNRDDYIENIINTNVTDNAIDLISDPNVGAISLQFINNLMTQGPNIIELFLQKQLYSTTIDLFQDGDFNLKKECVYTWSIIEYYGNDDQRRVIEQDIYINLFCESLDISDEEITLVALQTMTFIFSRNVNLIEYLDTSAVDEAESYENDEIQQLISELHEMHIKYFS